MVSFQIYLYVKDDIYIYIMRISYLQASYIYIILEILILHLPICFSITGYPKSYEKGSETDKERR